MGHTGWKCCQCGMYNWDITIPCTGRGTHTWHSLITCRQQGGQCELVKRSLTASHSKKSGKSSRNSTVKKCAIL